MSDLQADGLPVHGALVLNKILQKGKKQGHKENGWKDEEELMHAIKSIEHQCKHIRQLMGWNPPDGEDHDELAFARAGMVTFIANEKRKKRRKPGQ